MKEKGKQSKEIRKVAVFQRGIRRSLIKRGHLNKDLKEVKEQAMYKLGEEHSGP